ncbi:MAG: adenylate/guanylate cyclase domain-containing protein [Chthoniobacterales bacterium]
MPARVHVSPPSGEPFEIIIGNTATIGRTPDNTVCLSSDPRVSRQHSLIRCFNGVQYQLMDLGSRNGTYVNGHRVVTPVTLEQNAVIRISNHELRFETFEEGDSDGDGVVDVTIGTTGAGTDSSIQHVAILVCDIRGFSTVAETTTPDLLARGLGSWFAEAGNIVNLSGGTIDKFIGDAILAYWPKPSQGTISGVECAAALAVGQKFLAATEKRTWLETDARFRVGVALHFGPVTCGNIGLVAQRDATIIGDAVNTAFRLESVMKELNQDIVLSEDFANELRPQPALNDLGERQLKGKNQRVRVFGLADWRTPQADTLLSQPSN